MTLSLVAGLALFAVSPAAFAQSNSDLEMPGGENISCDSGERTVTPSGDTDGEFVVFDTASLSTELAAGDGELTYDGATDSDQDELDFLAVRVDGELSDAQSFNCSGEQSETASASASATSNEDEEDNEESMDGDDSDSEMNEEDEDSMEEDDDMDSDESEDEDDEASSTRTDAELQAELAGISAADYATTGLPYTGMGGGFALSLALAVSGALALAAAALLRRKQA